MRAVWVTFDVVGRACLEASVEEGLEVAGVVTLPGPVDPDRSGQCSFDDVAARHGAPLVEAADVNADDVLDAVHAVEPDLIFVVGWSQLVGRRFIEIPPYGVFGMHPTLLPRHRGRAPVPWTILSGLAKTGVTLFEIVDETADSGAILAQLEVPVEPDDTATTLFDRLAEAHVELVRQVVPALLDGSAPRIPQDPRRASAWPKRTPADGIIDWETRAPYLYDWVRAQTRPYPGAFTYTEETKLVVWKATSVPFEAGSPAGTVVDRSEDGVVVACGEGGLLLEEVQPEGAPTLSGRAIGERLPIGARLG
jgi:methionyl-tRNA formyltransferase